MGKTRVGGGFFGFSGLNPHQNLFENGSIASKSIDFPVKPHYISLKPTIKPLFSTLQDLFLVATTGELLKIPSRAAKVSDSAAVFQAVFERRSPAAGFCWDGGDWLMVKPPKLISMEIV